MRAYYGVRRESPVQFIWISGLLRPVPDFLGASGKRYTIYTPEMGLPAGRAHGLRKAMDAVIANTPLQDNLECLNSIKNAYNAMLKDKDAVMLGYTIQAAINNLLKSYTSEYHPAVMACTYFIIEEGEALGTWDERVAKAKVEDWKDVNEMDFFLCSLWWRAELSEQLTDYLAASQKAHAPKQSGNG